MSTKATGYVYLALAMMTVGSTVVASKVIAAGLPPFTATALRFAVALPVFLLLMRWRREPWPVLRRGDWLLLVLQALSGSLGYTALLLTGLRMTSAADAGVIVGTLPVVSALIATVLLRERPSARVWLALALATAGVIAVAWPGGETTQGSAASVTGNALVLGAVACEGIFILLNKRLRSPVSPVALSTLMTAIGLVAAGLAAMTEAAWRAPLQPDALWAVLYYALVPTVAGYLLWYAGAARTSGGEAALFTALAPPTAVALAALLLGEPVTPAQAAGMACVVLAVVGMGWRTAAASRKSAERSA